MKLLTTFLISVALLLQGCTSLRLVSKTNPELEYGDKITVELKSGISTTLELIEINEKQIEGYDRNNEIQILDLSAVSYVMIEEYDGKKTAHNVTKIAAGTVLVLLVATATVAGALVAPY